MGGWVGVCVCVLCVCARVCTCVLFLVHTFVLLQLLVNSTAKPVGWPELYM